MKWEWESVLAFFGLGKSKGIRKPLNSGHRRQPDVFMADHGSLWCILNRPKGAQLINSTTVRPSPTECLHLEKILIRIIVMGKHLIENYILKLKHKFRNKVEGEKCYKYK